MIVLPKSVYAGAAAKTFPKGEAKSELASAPEAKTSAMPKESFVSSSPSPHEQLMVPQHKPTENKKSSSAMSKPSKILGAIGGIAGAAVAAVAVAGMAVGLPVLGAMGGMTLVGMAGTLGVARHLENNPDASDNPGMDTMATFFVSAAAGAAAGYFAPEAVQALSAVATAGLFAGGLGVGIGEMLSGR